MEPTSTSELIRISEITIPQGFRKIKKATVQQIADSYQVDGQLQPIGVRRRAGGGYALVFGGHRLAAAKLQKWSLIEAHVLTMDDDDAARATDAENLFRNPLRKAELILALARWSQSYRQKYPQSLGRGGHPDPVERSRQKDGVTTFERHAAEATGIPRKTIQRYVALADHFEEADLQIFAERDIPYSDVESLSRLDDPETRRRAVVLVAGGVPPKKAIATATLPRNTTASEIVARENPPTEDQLADDEWLEQVCGEVRDRLKYLVQFDRDALLWRKTFDLRVKIRNSTRKILAQSKTGKAGPFYRMFTRFINVDHPKAWNPCGPCGGTGQSGNVAECGNCKGAAYVVKGVYS